MSVIATTSTGTPTAEERPDTNGSTSSLTKKLGRLSLNPNAQEFVPSAKSPVAGVGNGASGADSRSKANLDRTSSANSNNSDDEYRQFWRSQLPDDLISDSDFSQIYSEINQYDQQTSREFDLSYVGNRSAGLRKNERANGSYSLHQDEHSAHKVDGVELEQGPDDIHPLTLLASEFPNFAVRSLADIYHANGCDLHLTIEMLTQLELQEDGATTRRPAPAPTPTPALTPMDFPSLPGVDVVNGLSLRQEPRRPTIEFSSSISRRFGPGEQGIDFAAVVRKQVAQQPSHWSYERTAADATGNPGRTSVQSLGGYGYGSRAPQQPWLETGEAVASMYSDMREEAKDHARVRNAYFEQARQAYFLGNKALAKELGAKGQWHNEQMKAAHGKAAEAIFHQRNASLPTRDGQRMIDLHGLHVSEAIALLKRELSGLRAASRATSKRQCVYICIGTGHHTKGSRTPARIPVAIERYLAEDERLPFSEVQPGMLRVFVP